MIEKDSQELKYISQPIHALYHLGVYCEGAVLLYCVLLVYQDWDCIVELVLLKFPISARLLLELLSQPHSSRLRPIAKPSQVCQALGVSLLLSTYYSIGLERIEMKRIFELD